MIDTAYHVIGKAALTALGPRGEGARVACAPSRSVALTVPDLALPAGRSTSTPASDGRKSDPDDE
ncbi:hypothetical protein [Streptomyces sp. NPDC048584]|uniref:hypothetical protein n=1 Tax=Streptomyces sp. NPDC048584 TaxID=3365573 RepID=UPI0037239253